jgi:DNA polymerase-3 subunit alpha
MDNTDKLVVLKDDCTRQLGIAIEPPDVNRSDFGFAVAGERRIAYGLGAIKGVGQSVVEAILAERAACGPFTSLLDLCRRVDPQKLNRRVLEALVRSGAVDSLGANRATLLAQVPDTLSAAERAAYAAAAGQGTLFGGADETATELALVTAPMRDWTKRERLQAELESLGLYLTGHPFEEYAAHCEKFTNGSIAAAHGPAPSEGTQWTARREVRLAGVVTDVRRRGNRVFLVLDDDTERIEVMLFDEVAVASKHLLAKYAVLVVDGQLRFDEFANAWRIVAKRVRSADQVIEETARRLTIPWLRETTRGADFVAELKRVLEPFRGGPCEVCLHYRNDDAEALLTLGEAWCVSATRELRDRLSVLLGDEPVKIHYPKHIV